jgi:hypothetical protein
MYTKCTFSYTNVCLRIQIVSFCIQNIYYCIQGSVCQMQGRAVVYVLPRGRVVVVSGRRDVGNRPTGVCVLPWGCGMILIMNYAL